MRSGFRQLRGCPLDFQCCMSSVQASPGCRMQLRQARQWLAAMQRRQALRAEAARPDKTDEIEGGTGGPAGVA